MKPPGHPDWTPRPDPNRSGHQTPHRLEPPNLATHPEGRLPPGLAVPGALEFEVAFLSRSEGRLPPEGLLGLTGDSRRCDPQPPRRTAATCRPCRGGQWPGGCDPQPSRRTAATPTSASTWRSALDVAILSRPGGRLPQVTIRRYKCRWGLRSSAAPKDGCHPAWLPLPLIRRKVAILSRPEGRLPQREARAPEADQAVAILSRPEGRLPQREARAPEADQAVAILSRPEGRLPLQAARELGELAELRSSAAPKDGCHAPPFLGGVSAGRLRSSAAPKDGCHRCFTAGCAVGAGLRSSAAPKDGCHRQRTNSISRS